MSALEDAIALWEKSKAQGPPVSQADDPYAAARATFVGQHAPDERSTFAATPGEFRTNDAGQILFGNGVMADPTSGAVMYPPGADVPGSEPWLASIQSSWSDKQVASWRGRLADQGYQVAEKGGWAMDLVGALRAYHQARYLNYGKALPLMPGGATGAAAGIRKTVDREMVKETIKGWGDLIWDEPLDDDVADWWAERQIELAVQLMKKNPEWTPDQALAGAELRASQEFEKSPGIKGAIRDAEQLEGSTKLRDSMVSLSQVVAV